MTELFCSGFEEFAQAIRGADSRVMLTGREESAWWIRSLTLGRFELQLAQEGAANIFDAASWADSFNVLISLDGAAFALNGQPFANNRIGVLPGGRTFTSLAQGRNSWASISFPYTHLQESALMGDARLERLVNGDVAVINVDIARVGLLRQLVRRLLARAEAGHLSARESAEAAGAELMAAVLFALLVDEEARSRAGRGRPAVSRRVVLDRALALMHSRGHAAMAVSDLAQASGVSERTLRSVFLECFGVSPLAYFRIRQVHDFHRELMSAESEVTTVTGIAMRLGIWDLDSMSARYRDVFGETPGATLRRRRAGATTENARRCA